MHTRLWPYLAPATSLYCTSVITWNGNGKSKYSKEGQRTVSCSTTRAMRCICSAVTFVDGSLNLAPQLATSLF
jgi:hypothetical protein